MPILGPDGQPANLPRAIGAKKLSQFPPMEQAALVELRAMVGNALAGGVPPAQTVALPLEALAQLLMTLEVATEILLSQDGARPPIVSALDDAKLVPTPHTTRVTYWQDDTLQVERWNAPEDGAAHIGVIGHGSTVYEALDDARPMAIPSISQMIESLTQGEE